MSYKSIGNYLRLVDNRNKDSLITNVLGINITKNFMSSLANTSESDLSKYKIIKKGQFAYSSMQVGRDETIRIALYSEDIPAIISPAYLVIEIKNENELLPEFMMMFFQRPESDRYGWFISDSSVRASLDWERFCEIEIPIPQPEEQLKFVNLYKGLLDNQKVYENSLDDLQLICNSLMDNLKTRYQRKPLSKLVSLVDNRNSDKNISNLQGINIEKEFIQSLANVSIDNLSKYKIINNKQFAFSPMQVGRDETVRIALYKNSEPAIISPAYFVFEVINNLEVMPEFLMLWFYRPEFNRYGWFLSDASVRASLDLETLMQIEITVPNLKEQEAIVNLYHALETRKRINEQLKNTIKPLCPVLMRGVAESFNSRGHESK